MIYAKLAGILLSVIGLFALGYHFGEMPYKTKYEALQAADWEGKAKGEEAAKTVLAGQLIKAQTTAQTNAETTQRLQNENAQITADRDTNIALARRLLAGQARPASDHHSGSQGPIQPGTPVTSGAGRDDSIAGLLVDAADECERNANRLDALIAEVKAQL